MNAPKREIVAYAGLTLMTVIIGFSFIFVKMALQHASPIDLLAHRFTVATAALFLFYLFRRKGWPLIDRKRLFSLLLLSLFYPLLLFSMQTIGLQFTTASEAGILSATAPVFTLILASLFLKEESSFWQIMSVLLSVAGVVYIMYKNGLGEISSETLKGDFFILLSVVSTAIYFVLGRKVTQQLNAMDITFFMTLTACIVFNLIAISVHLKSGTIPLYFSAFTNSEFLWTILYLGVLSSFLTSFLTNSALTVIPASQVSAFNNFSPVIAIFSGVLFLNESLHLYHIIGGIMVLIGIIGVNVLKKI
ncbi:DMT family transporter [Proteiniphilum sp.]|uniref:DMT family transporter n=1 Tax=Proteiniphilum sp. TaxID=1926877 RepID=UPI002B1F9024|nr:DMT family transporter [Proteiniphilum sp.]MEA4916440.1 DMT family transporter [Proteiniphilum sp.]